MNVDDIKALLGITGTAQDATLTGWMDTTKTFVRNAGVPESAMDAGLIARGVADLWNYGAGEGKFSQAFLMMVAQRAEG